MLQHKVVKNLNLIHEFCTRPPEADKSEAFICKEAHLSIKKSDASSNGTGHLRAKL